MAQRLFVFVRPSAIVVIYTTSGSKTIVARCGCPPVWGSLEEADQVTLNPEPPPIFAGNRASQAPGVCRPRLGGGTSDRASGSRRFRRGRVHSLRGAVQDANSLLTRLSVQKPRSRCPICYAGEEVDHRSLLCGSDSGNAGGKAAAKNASRGKRAPVWHFDADLEPTIGHPVPTRFGTAAGMFNIGPLTSRHESREE